jgi:Tol biopolymer transport system component
MGRTSLRLHRQITVFILLMIPLFTVACGTLEAGIEPDAKVENAKTQPAEILPTEQLGTDQRQTTPTPVPEDYAPPTPAPAFTPIQPDAYPAPPGLRVAFVMEGDIWLWTAGSKKAVPLTTRDDVVGDIKISDDGILVAFRRGEEGELWTVSSDGAGERQVLSTEDLEAMESEGVEVRLHHFEWVPNTHTLAYNTRLRREAGDVPADDLRLVDADTMEHTIVLSPGEGGEFHYSPDGSQIAVVTAGDISLVDADGGNRRDGVLTYAPVMMYSGSDYYVQPTWGADDRSLLVAIPPADPHTRPTQHTTIWRIPTDSASASLVSSIAAIPEKGSVAFSHELNFMIYAEMPELPSGTTPPTEAQAWMKLVRLENGDWFRYPDYGGTLFGWAPKSRRFAFLSDVGDQVSQLQIGQWSGRTIPGSVDAGTPVHDVRWVDADHYLLVTGRARDGYELLLADVNQGSAVLASVESSWLAYDVANAGPQIADTTPTSAVEPMPSPTAKPTSVPAKEDSTLRVIFIRDDNVRMWTERSGAATLTLSGDVTDAKISDDGAVVAYTKQLNEQRAELWAVNSDGSEARRLVSADDLSAIDPSALAVAIHDFEWVPGSHTVAYSTRKVVEGPGVMPYDDLWQVDTDTLERTALLSPGEGGDFTYSPDGRQIAIVSPQQISLINADGGNRRDVLAYSPVATYSEFRFYARPVWAADSRSLRVGIPPADPLAETSQPTGIWHIPTDGAPASLLAEIDPEPLRGSHAFASDLSHVAYLARPEGALPRVAASPLLITDLRSGEIITYYPHADGIYGWAPNSARFAFLGDGERQKALIGQVGIDPQPAYGDAYTTVSDLRWVDADRCLFPAHRDGHGWDIVLAEVGGASEVLATVSGRPPVYDVVRAVAQPGGGEARASDAFYPQPAAVGWRSYSNPRFAIALKHPRDWQRVPEYGGPDSGERFAGVDGFIMIDAIGSPNADIDDVTVREAQHKLQPYGSRPTIENLEVEGQEARLILPSGDANMEGQAALIVGYPQPVSIGGSTYEFLVLYADQDHIRAIGQTLRFETTLSATEVAPSEGPAWRNLPPGLIYHTADALWQIGVDEAPLKVSNDPEAVLSPDGTRLLGYDAANRDPWVFDLAKGTEWSLAQTPDHVECCLRWWPQRPDVVLFDSDEKGAEPSPGRMGYLAAADVDGQGWRILDEAHDAGPEQFAPSPDGQMIAYGGGSTGWLYHWEVGPESFDPADYGLTGTKGIHIGSPAWSPDGRRLAWVVGGGLAADGDWRIAIGVFDLEARTSYLLHPYVPAGRGGWPPAPAWSPDGCLIALVTWDQNAKAPGLWVAPSDGGEEEFELGRGDSPVWSPDGHWLAFNGALQNGESRILLAQVGTWEPRSLELPPGARLVDWASPLAR